LTSFTLLILMLVQGDRARELIERLRSDDADQRNQATLALKKLGKEAVPRLEIAARDPDLEVASRARSALNAIAFLGRIPSRFSAAFPGVEDRLMVGEDRVAAELLSQAAVKLDEGAAVLRVDDLQWIAPAAVRGSRSIDQLVAVLTIVRQYRLTAAVFEVLDLLDDAPGDLRYLVMETVTSLGGERPEAAFYGQPSLADDQIVRVCLAATEDLPGDLVERAFRRCLEAPRPLKRRLAIRGLARLGLQNTLPLLLNYAEDASDAVRSDVLLAIGDLGGRDRSGMVLRGLGDASLRVRTSAIVAAGKLHEERAVPQLLALLSDPNLELQCASCRALGMLGAAEAIPEMLRLFIHGGGSVRQAAADGLRRFDAALVAPGLMKETAGKPLDLRLRGVELLGDLEASAAAPALAELLTRDEPEALRIEVLRALMRIGAGGVRPKVLPLLDDPSPQVRSIATRVLAELGGDDLAPRLLESLEAEDPNAKYHAVMGLLALGARSSAGKIAPLALAVRNPDWVRLAALKAIEKLGGPDEIRTLKPLLGDPLYEIRSTTAKVLCWIGDPDAVGVVFEETRNWICLNAIRTPEEWAKLTDLPVGEDLRGTRRDVLERLAMKAGKTLEWSLVGECRGPDLAVFCTVQGRRKSVAEALREPLPTGVEFVVEKDRIRVIPREKASDFWKAWRDERGRSRE